ncbi:unnamed protein product [Clonostachys rosea]|uniref:Protein kinase domain-containing protein n=1 Tax=Bionectria ochroleuca TaxID=29856 RepID=A0ABY6U6X6_BIOOC|nr:unnamed protein product [Clonostachys rosea]
MYHRPVKLELPYKPGVELFIRNHTPPQPFGAGYEREFEPRRCISIYHIEHSRVSQLEWCLNNPLIETTPPKVEKTHNLHILDKIASKRSRRTQVLKCCLGSEKDKVFVAKIFDPLFGEYPEDVTFLADVGYSREAAAYEEIQKAGMDGRYTPKYYGSWTFGLPTPNNDSQLRPVRMVLPEFLSGMTMFQVMYKQLTFHISPEDRLKILAEAFEIDRCGQNMQNYEYPKVMLFDFNIVYVTSRPNCSRPSPLEPRPAKPLYSFWFDFEEWRLFAPRPHKSRIEFWRGWLLKLWAHNPDYSDPSDDFKPWEEYQNPNDPPPIFMEPEPDPPHDICPPAAGSSCH